VLYVHSITHGRPQNFLQEGAKSTSCLSSPFLPLSLHSSTLHTPSILPCLLLRPFFSVVKRIPLILQLGVCHRGNAVSSPSAGLSRETRVVATILVLFVRTKLLLLLLLLYMHL